MACADVEAGEQERDSEHGAARIGGHGAGLLRIEQLIYVRENLRSPHGWVFGEGKWVVENRVGCRDCSLFGFFEEPLWEVADA